MTLVPGFLAPLFSSRFRASVEPWTVVGYPDAGTLRVPAWSAVGDAAAINSDITGGASYTPAEGESNWYFRVALGSLLPEQRNLFGGTLAYALDTRAASSAADAQPSPVKTPSPDIILKTQSLALGLDVPVASPLATSGPLARQRIVVAWLTEMQGWRSLASGEPAARGELETLLADHTLEILIRGDIAGDVVEARLSAFEIYQDPEAALALPVTVEYADDVINATWTPSPYAASYEVKLKDGSGAVVVTKDVAAPAGSLSIPIPDAARSMTDYTVDVRVVGPPSYGPIAIVRLGKPVVTVVPVDGGIKVSWPAIEQAASYAVTVEPQGGGSAVVTRPGVTAIELNLGTRDGLAAATDYRVTVRAVAGQSLGSWSDPVAFRLVASQDILATLRDRLIASRRGGKITFDTTTLPADGPGAPGRVLERLRRFFPEGADSLAIVTSDDPKLSPADLRLTGPADFLGCEGGGLDAVFTVTDDLLLQLTIQVQPEDDWTFGYSFPDLSPTAWQYLPLATPRLIFTTFDHTDPAWFFPLRAGLNLAGSLIVSPGLQNLAPYATADGNFAIDVGGAVSVDATGTTLALSGKNALPPLTVSLIGFDPLTVTDGTVKLQGAPDPAGGRSDALQIDGFVEIKGERRNCSVELPTYFRSAQRIVIAFPPREGATIAELVALIAGGAGFSGIPDFIGTLPIAAVKAFGYEFTSDGSQPTQATLRLGTAQSWSFLEALPVKDLQLDLTITKSATPAWSTYAAQLSGSVTLGRSTLTATIYMVQDGDWALTLVGDPAPTLVDVLALAGVGADTAFAAFPRPLRPIAEIGLSDILLLGDPHQRTLSRLTFTLSQTAPWSITDAVEVHDGSLAVTLEGTPRTASALMSATVRLGSVTMRARIPLPQQPDRYAEIALAEGERVTLPGIDDLVALFGGGRSTAPANVDRLSSLVLDRLVLRFDLARTPVVREVIISIAQVGPWVVIDPDKLVVRDFGGHFRMDAADSGIDTSVDVHGTVVICGTAANVRFHRMEPQDDWTLIIADEEPVRIGDINQLDSWMGPGEAGGYLGSDVPVSGGGAELSDVYLRFASDSAQLKSLSFALRVVNPWDIIAGKLAINEVYCRLRTTMPLSSSTWTGEIGGIVTVLDAPFLVSATKPDVASPWSFAGRLLRPATIDLVAAANSISSQSFSLPADIQKFGGFPAAVTIEAAQVETTPATGRFRLTGEATFQDWNVGFGSATLQIKSLGGDVSQAKRGDPVKALIAGSLNFASLDLDLFLQLSTDAAVDTVLLGILTPEKSRTLSLGPVTDGVAGAETWKGIPLPADFSPPGLDSAALYLNLTTEVMILFGRAARFGSAAFLLRKLPAEPASAVEKPAAGKDETPTNDGAVQPSDKTAARYGAALIVNIEPSTRFGDILPALAPIDGLITLDRLSLSISSFDIPAGGENPYAALASVNQAASSFPSPVTLPQMPEATRIARGLNFDGSLRLTGTLWENLKFVIEVGANNRIAVHATVDDKEPANTVFQASLGGFVILRTVALAKAELEYRPKGKTLTLMCEGSVAIPGRAQDGTDAEQLFRFSGNALVTEAAAKAAFAAAIVNQTLSHPLGIPGITLGSLSLTAEWVFTPNSTGGTDRELTLFEIGGTFQLGGAADLSGAVVFVDGSPKVVRLSLDKPVSMNEFFAQCIGTDAWNLLPELTLLRGRLYYAPAAVAEPKYEQGFHLAVDTEIFSHTFHIEASATENDGIAGTASATGALDLEFLKLTGPQGGDTGPQVGISAKKQEKKFDFGFGFDLFGLSFRDGHLSYLPPSGGDAARYTGKITYVGPDTPLGSSFTLEAEWTEKDGFRITNWPAVPKLPDIDLEDLLEKAGSKDLCGALGALGIGKDAIKGECKAAMRVSKGASATDADGKSIPVADVEIDVWYEISINIGKKVVLNPGTKPLTLKTSIKAPASYSFEDLCKFIIKAIVNAVPDFVESILKDPQALAELVAAIGAEKLTNKAIDSLLCRKVDVKARPDPKPDDPPNQGDEDLTKAADKVAEAVAADTATAAAEAAALAIGFATAAAGFFGAILETLNKIKEAFAGKSDEQKRAEAKQARAEELKRQADDAVKQKLQISGLHTTYEALGRIRIDWNFVSDSNASYVITVKCDGQDVWNSGPLSAGILGRPSTTLPNPVFVPGTIVSVYMYATISGYQGATAADTLVIPDFAPVGLTIEQVEKTFALRWKQGPVEADSYTLRIQRSGGEELPSPPVPKGSFEATVAQQLQAGSTYTAALTAAKRDNPERIVTAGPVTFLALAAPENLRAEHLSGTNKITVRWDGPADAADFLVAAYRDLGSPIGQWPSPAGASLAEIDNPAFVPPGPFLIRVASRTAKGETVWSVPVEVSLVDLAKPTVLALDVNASPIEARWTSVPGAAAGYEVELTSEPQAFATAPVADFDLTAPPEGQPNAERYPLARFAGVQLVSGQTLRFRVRARAGNSRGPWSDVDKTSTAELPAIEPVGCTIEQRGAALIVRWRAGVGGPRPYEVRLLDAAGQVIVASPDIPVDQEKLSAVIRRPEFSAGSTYSASVHAIDPRLASSWAESDKIAYAAPPALPAPLLQGVAISGLTVSATWSQVSGNGGYKFELRAADDSEQPIVHTTGLDETAISFDLAPSAIPRSYFARVQAMAGDDEHVESEWSTRLGLKVPGTDSWRVFWSGTEDAHLRSAGLEGSDLKPIASAVKAGLLAADNINGKLYYAQDGAAGAIRRMNFDGSEDEVIVGALGKVGGLAVDPHDGYLFWAHMNADGRGAIQRSDLAGGNIIDVNKEQQTPAGIAIDPRANLVYWMAGGTQDPREIYAAQFDGTGFRRVFAAGELTSGAQSPQINAAGSHLYWICMYGVARLDLGTSEAQRVVPGDNLGLEPGCLALLPGTGEIVWSETHNGLIRTAKEDGSAARTLVDQQPGVNGIAIFTGPVAPAVKSALYFNGTNASVSLENPAKLDITGKVTLMAWVRIEATDVQRNILVRGDTATAAPDLYLRINEGGYEIGCSSPDAWLDAPIPSEDKGQWVHLAGTYDGSRWSLYRNGRLLASSAITTGLPQITGGWAIGSNDAGSQHFFQGHIAGAAIWNVALEAEDIRNCMIDFDPSRSGLLGYWPLDDGQGNICRDLGPGARQSGEVRGAVWAQAPAPVARIG
jgi:hypothetical protein